VVRSVAVWAWVVFIVGISPAFGQNPFDTVTGPLSNEDTRLTTGVESLSASGTKGQQHLLIDLMISAPLGQEVTRKTKPKATAWLNARFNGATTNSVSGVKQFVGGFEKQLISGDVSSLLNSMAFRAGVEIKLPKADGFQFGNDFQFQPTVIAAVGVQTVPAFETPSVFDLSTDARKRWGVEDPKYKYIALAGPDRREFYGAFEVGLRLKTHHFNECEPPAHEKCSRDRRRNFPGIVDLTLGQDAAVTGGERRGVVARVDAFYPLPTDNIANAIYLFGAIRIQRVDAVEAESPAIILRAPTATVSLPSDEVFQHTLTPNERTRDEWKFGMGVDLVRLFTAATTARAADAASAAQEDGSIVELAKNDDLRVIKRTLDDNETRTFNHGVDVIIPIDDAELQATSIPPPGTDTVVFKKDTPRLLLAVKRKLTNRTGKPFRAIVVKVIAGEGRAKMPDPMAKIEEELSPKGEEKYRASIVTCDAMCKFSYDDKVDNTLAIVPLADGKIKVGTKDEAPVKAYEAIVVPRKTAVAVAGQLKFVLVRVP
jgi:hypothetical protein